MALAVSMAKHLGARALVGAFGGQCGRRAGRVRRARRTARHRRDAGRHAEAVLRRVRALWRHRSIACRARSPTPGTSCASTAEGRLRRVDVARAVSHRRQEDDGVRAGRAARRRAYPTSSSIPPAAAPGSSACGRRSTRWRRSAGLPRGRRPRFVSRAGRRLCAGREGVPRRRRAHRAVGERAHSRLRAARAVAARRLHLRARAARDAAARRSRSKRTRCSAATRELAARVRHRRVPRRRRRVGGARATAHERLRSPERSRGRLQYRNGSEIPLATPDAAGPSRSMPPICRATSRPFLNAISVGMPRMPNRAATRWLLVRVDLGEAHPRLERRAPPLRSAAPSCGTVRTMAPRNPRSPADRCA